MDEFVSGLLPELVELRRGLHREPELSNREAETAARLAEQVAACSPDELRPGIGGHGLIAIFGEQPHPGLLLRADIDALPIPDDARLPHCSTRPSVGHKCGHDGHATMLVGVARWLARHRPRRGRVILLFQPAEETGEGAERVLADPAFAPLSPDWVFALHNLPGFAAGAVIVRPKAFAAASVGLEVSLHGATSHAAYPEHGRSPALALAELIEELSALPASPDTFNDTTLLTIIHLTLGTIAFGTSPGEAELRATLRAFDPIDFERLEQRAVERVEQICAAHGLSCEHAWREPFPATVNDPEAVATIRRVCERASVPLTELAEPFRWSEDFGAFCARYPGALFGLGAGEQHPELHHPDYDFPDEILAAGLRVWIGLIDAITGERAA